MSNFTQLPLARQHTVGEQLRSAREAQQLSLEDISQRIRVSVKYLDAIERGHYRELPSLVYARQYVRLYAKAVQLPWHTIASLYHDEVRVYAVQPGEGSSWRAQRSSRTTGGAYQQAPLVIPRLFRYGAIGMLILLVIVYFVWEVVQFLSPPQLVILSPERDMIVSQREFEVIGETAPEAVVEINGQTVRVDPDGHFTERVYLQEGLNTLRVSSRSKHSQEHVQVRHVLYDTTHAPETNQQTTE